jgi:hypothetical protein
MKAYIAGKWGARERLRVIAEKVRWAGHEVTSSWLLPTIGVAEGEWSQLSGEEAARTAKRDLDEIANSECLILDTIDESNTGGREVEWGFALAVGLVVARVGPARNGFHALCPGFDSWDECLTVLERIEPIGQD